MTNEPAGAAEALAAFERAASEPDPIFAFSEGFAVAFRSHGRGVLSEDGCGELGRALTRAQEAVGPHAPAAFRPRLRDGVNALAALLQAWAAPAGAPERSSAEVEFDHLNVRIVANDLDTICAMLEIERGTPTRPGLLAAAQPMSATAH
ncbi:hypothetical protein [Methylobacterium soli]|uniref:Uncharacterized protein n=1 Tax=Methylobacterium soli TaxID=553447 RepID=A0A6L3SRH3_9HYPH|nr:hypothetical protein [Methylobacterium soli]KAB1075398.1 hypothetical protein F6X53_24830 [Methylobacterium soli]GJE43776.1 hypothetical protein AEGHOMDF_2955 [Methylobacterium soli]